ncbi:MAG: erythromycin esterase family protein [Actinomycetota bacterium]
MGAIYRPETERASHYFRARLSDQFDAVIHIDDTRAVEPLERTTVWKRAKRCRRPTRPGSDERGALGAEGRFEPPTYDLRVPAWESRRGRGDALSRARYRSHGPVSLNHGRSGSGL